MTFIEKIELIRRVDALIRRKGTGTAEELAERLNISRRCVFDLLNMMKQMGGPILYNQDKKTYEYERDCKLFLNYVDADKINGGNHKRISNIFDSAEILHWEGIDL